MNSQLIEQSILRLCEQPRTFEFISAQLSGFDPVELLEILSSLESRRSLEDINGFWCTRRPDSCQTYKNVEEAKAGFFNEYIGFFGLFDKPHPLDFEWRNSTATLDYLISGFSSSNDFEDKILLLGFPTLFAAACMRNVAHKVTLVEKNAAIIKGLERLNAKKGRFQIIGADIFTVAPETVGEYHSVVMDPPWYPPHFYQFMWLAAQCVEVGGTIAISMPPINTRPTISEERVAWFSFCQEQGLCLESLETERLNYAMPFFEYNAFRAAGLEGILPFWRKGDLAIFRKVNEVSTSRPAFDNPLTEWVEREFEGVRIRINLGDGDKGDQSVNINHIVKGDILPSISARDGRRELANVWTSGNRVYRVNNPDRLVELLDDLKRLGPVTPELQVVDEFIVALTALEMKEYNDYSDWLYHEMERQSC